MKHGHVTPNPDGSRARCGGPGTCMECSLEEAGFKVRVELGPDIERLRMQLAACGVAAMCNTKESMGTQRIGKDNPYWCASYGDVCNAVDREIALREENAALREALEWIRGPHQSKSGEDYTDLEFDMVMKAERTLAQPKKSPSQTVSKDG